MKSTLLFFASVIFFLSISIPTFAQDPLVIEDNKVKVNTTLVATGETELKSLKVTGNTSLQTLNVTGDAAFNALNSSGSTTLNTLKVNNKTTLKTLNVSGTTSFNTLDVSDRATINDVTIEKMNNDPAISVSNSKKNNWLRIKGGTGLGLFGSISKTSPGVFVSADNRVGIYTTNTSKAILEIGTGKLYALGSYGWLNENGNTGTDGGKENKYYSIYASYRIAAQEFNAHSDRRIKAIQRISDAQKDLATLMNIEITDYRLKDTVANGSFKHKKVIAQQVMEVYPQAVHNDVVEVVPDIFQRATMQDAWVNLTTDLKKGDRIRLITETNADVYEVLEVEAHRFKVAIEATSQEERVFVYGREVKDFHTVDYDAISMLNVSATQELARRVAQLEAENNQLKKDKQALSSQLVDFNDRLKRLEANLEQ